ncbi:MAG: Ig-like domain repeat protein [Dokdonella sp.]
MSIETIRSGLRACAAIAAPVLFALGAFAMVLPSRAATPAVSAGGTHTCALTASGAISCWGMNLNGQLGDNSTTGRTAPVTVYSFATGAAAVAAGGSHTCALTTAGGVKCWGNNANGQLGDNSQNQRQVPVDVVGLTSGVQAVAAGSDHSCALTITGGVRCWGNNANGQLGDNSLNQRLTPINVQGLTSGVTGIAAGGNQTCALTSAGALKCWGSNSNGQLGDNSVTQRPAPVDVSGLSGGVAAIEVGATHACAVVGGAAKCWGNNGNGQVGDNTQMQRLVPTDVSGLGSGVGALAAGGAQTCALSTTGAVSCWGNNATGQLGDGTSTQSLAPVAAIGLAGGATAITAGTNHSCAITASGGIKCWGDNSAGQLGDGFGTQRQTAVDVTGLGSGVAAVTAGGNHSCALTAAGGVKCWGANGSGELGDNSTTARSTPVAVNGLGSGIAALSAGSTHTCAVTTGGGVKCWGSNSSGELGDNSTTQRLTPVDVPGLTSGVAAVAAGGDHSCALTTGGGVKCWGGNSFGQLGDSSVTQRMAPVNVTGLTSGVAAIAVGNTHSCARTTGGGVKCWGANSSGQLGDNSTTARTAPVNVSGLTTGVSAVTAGHSHTCALTTSGAAKCWGYNIFGQLGDGTVTQRLTQVAVAGLTSGVAAINAGDYHTCAVTTGGGAKCWGYDAAGQLGDNGTSPRLTAVDVVGLTSGMAATAGGLSHTCGRTTGGAAKCWGYGFSGQLGDGTFNFYPVPQFVVELNLTGGPTLVSSLNPSTFGDSVNLTVTVTGDSPTGTVNVRDGGVTIAGCGALVLNAGQATCMTATLTLGAHSITAVYSGDPNNGSITSAVLTQTVNAMATTTTLQSSANPSAFGQSVTFTATVNGQSPTGTVAFKDGGATIAGCSATVVSVAVAQCATATLSRATHAITAVYSGDGNNGTSTSTPLSQIVNIASTTTTLGAAPNPSTYFQSVTFTATITGMSVSGTVAFKDNGNVIAGCAANNVIAGTAQCSRNDLAGGTHPITAEYSGDTNHMASVSSPLSQVVNAVSTTTTLGSSGSPSSYGQNLMFTATVTGQSPGGTVNFKDGATSVAGCGAVAVSLGTAQCATTTLPVGPHSIIAVYSGDTNNSASTSTTLSQVVNKFSASLALASQVNPTTYGQGATFTATITGQSATGSVTFKDGAATIAGCSSVALFLGAAQCVSNGLGVGSHSVTAVYAGDGNNAGATSSIVSQVVNKAATTTAVGSSGSPSSYGASVTFTATVNGQTPAGTVIFKDGASSIAGCAAVTLSGGQAQCATAALASGTRSITAVYGGDGNNTGSTSAALSQLVNPAVSTTSLASSLNPSTFGQSTTFTATVSGQTATGTIAFKDGANTIAGCGAQALSGGGQAQCSTAALATGLRSISALYSGDGNNAGSTSGVLMQTVNTAPTTTALGSSINPSTLGQSVTFTATVTGMTATGTVQFQDGAGSIAGCDAVALSGGGQAQCATAVLAGGWHNVTAVYSGDGNNAGSASSILMQTINVASTTTVLMSAANPSPAGQNITLSVTVSGQSPGGMALFKDGANPIAGCESVPLVSGQAQCTLVDPGVGAHTLSAEYSGDSNHAPSTSNTVDQVVSDYIVASTVVPSATGPIHRGQQSTIVATVTGGDATPEGVIDVQGAGGACMITLVNGSGMCQLLPIMVGNAQNIAGSYGGDATHAAGTGSTQLTVKSTLDVDENGDAEALTDGLLILRYLSGFTDDALIADALGAGANVVLPVAVANYLLEVLPLLDIDGDGNADALTDGILLIRYLSGLRGDALINGAVGEGATRTTATDIESYLASLLP